MEQKLATTKEPSVQARMTRRFVASHMLKHIEGQDGCMICEAFQFGLSSEPGHNLVHELHSLAEELEEMNG